jgi:hypothetical protein
MGLPSPTARYAIFRPFTSTKRVGVTNAPTREPVSLKSSSYQRKLKHYDYDPHPFIDYDCNHYSQVNFQFEPLLVIEQPVGSRKPSCGLAHGELELIDDFRKISVTEGDL